MAQQRIGAPSPYNKTAWNKLPDIPISKEAIEAVLLEYEINGDEGKPAWEFLINPRSLRQREAAEYSTITPHAARVSYKHFSGSSGRTLNIPDLKMSTFCYGKSLRPLIEGARELVKAKPEEDIFAPPLLLFRMGTLRFGPCVVEAIEWDEEAWLSGDPARMTMSLVLMEVPRPLTDAEWTEQQRLRQDREAARREEQGLPRVPLTNRQREDASNLAKQYLTSNGTAWRDDLQANIPQDRYGLETDSSTGDVWMFLEPGRQRIGRVGRYNGREFRVGGTLTSIPTVDGQPRAEQVLGGRNVNPSTSR